MTLPFLNTSSRRVAFYTLVHNLYGLLAGGFEIALILRLTGSFERIIFFNLVYFVLLYVFFVVGTFLLRSGKASRSFRLDLVVMAASCFYLIVCFGSLGNPWILAGFFALKGVSEGVFWSTRHSAILHCVADENRDRWSMQLQTLAIVLGMILPLLSGFAINYWVWPAGEAMNSVLPSGYLSVYGLTGVLALVAVLVSPPLEIPAQTVRVRPMVGALRSPQQGTFLVYLFFGDLSWIVVTIALGILNFTVLKTEFNLGLFAAWIAAASAVFFFGLAKLLARFPLSRIRMVFLGASGDAASRILYLIFPTVPGLVAKSLLDSFVVPLTFVFGENIIRRRIELLSQERSLSLAEAVLFQESLYLVSRIVVCTALWLVLRGTGWDPASAARALLLAFAAYGFVDFLLLRSIDLGNRRREASPTFVSKELDETPTKL